MSVDSCWQERGRGCIDCCCQIGKERILAELAGLDTKVGVWEERLRVLGAIGFHSPSFVAGEPQDARILAVPFHHLHVTVNRLHKTQPLLVIIPTGQFSGISALDARWKWTRQYSRSDRGGHSVRFRFVKTSSHSSDDELHQFLARLHTKRLVPIARTMTVDQTARFCVASHSDHSPEKHATPPKRPPPPPPPPPFNVAVIRRRPSTHRLDHNTPEQASNGKRALRRKSDISLAGEDHSSCSILSLDSPNDTPPDTPPQTLSQTPTKDTSQTPGNVKKRGRLGFDEPSEDFLASLTASTSSSNHESPVRKRRTPEGSSVESQSDSNLQSPFSHDQPSSDFLHMLTGSL